LSRSEPEPEKVKIRPETNKRAENEAIRGQGEGDTK